MELICKEDSKGAHIPLIAVGQQLFLLTPQYTFTLGLAEHACVLHGKSSKSCCQAPIWFQKDWVLTFSMPNPSPPDTIRCGRLERLPYTLDSRLGLPESTHSADCCPVCTGAFTVHSAALGLWCAGLKWLLGFYSYFKENV